jgi:hypothetical protein
VFQLLGKLLALPEFYGKSNQGTNSIYYYEQWRITAKKFLTLTPGEIKWPKINLFAYFHRKLGHTVCTKTNIFTPDMFAKLTSFVHCFVLALFHWQRLLAMLT